MTIQIPELGLIGTLYLMALCAFFLCMIANKLASIKPSEGSNGMAGFWTFIAVCSGGTMIGAFAMASFLMISRSYPATCT